MTAVLADTLEDLTPEWFTAALRAGGAIGPDASVASADAALFGTGQFGLVARAELTYVGGEAEAPASVIVKLPSQDPGSRELGIAIGAYEAEVRFYKEIAPRSGVSVPKPYWEDFEHGTGRVTLVLEDLSSDWQVGDAVAGGTVAQAEAALDQAARLHADLWDQPDLKELGWLASPERTQMLFDRVAPALPEFRERFAERLRPEQMDLVEKLAPRAAEYPGRAWQGPLVVAHCDFRLDNAMFREGEDGLEATVIDWQSLRLGPPGIDVALWLGSCLSAEDRRANQDQLLRRYHDGLTAHGVEGFSYEDCVASVRAGSLWAFLLSIPVSVTLERSDRGDEMFVGMIVQNGALVADLGADTYLT